MVDPTGAGRKLRPAHSHESLDDVNPKGKGKGRTKDNKPKENPNGKKPTKPNFAAKAHVKVKNGRTTLTESKYWLRKMDEEKAQEDITKRKVLLALNSTEHIFTGRPRIALSSPIVCLTPIQYPIPGPLAQHMCACAATVQSRQSTKFIDVIISKPEAL